MSGVDFCDLAVPGVQGLQPYQPGKPIAELQREYGVTDVVKLASNENPLGISPLAGEAVKAALAEAHRYPDGNGYYLKQALADHHGMEPGRITLGNGSNDILDLVARVFLGPGRKGVFSQHAFAIYALATQTVGGEGVTVPALPADHPEQPFGHDLEAMAAAVDGDTRVVFVANPNNPTGNWCDRASVEAFLERVPVDVAVVMDEAYIEYANMDGFPDTTAYLDAYPNLIVTRTFSKAYGLAGLRVGYALSTPAVADLLNRVRHPFNANSLAQSAATAALGDRSFIQRSVNLNEAERPRVAAALDDLGYRCLPSAGNFVCVDVGDAAAVNEALLRRGVIVRPLGGYGLPQCLRISIGTAAENDRLLAALGEIAAQRGAS
ncbi:histidinol-phosphate transaminase [Ectothiorhodospiraceae bacterium WFHF3C12]|nr:histidinol-phosphate transaminase [Ectothiorhodospiraceae bacterium WFHF3C12]